MMAQEKGVANDNTKTTDLDATIEIPDDSVQDVMSEESLEKMLLTRSTQSQGSHELDKISLKEWKEKIASPQKSNRTSTSTSSSKGSRKGEVLRHSVSNYMDYKEFLKNYDTSLSLYIFFCGSNSPNSGYSWCQCCIKALPLVEEALKHVHSAIFLITTVGMQEDWEDKSNPYRLDKHLKLKVIPTLLKHKTPRRLQGEYCLKPELLELLFEDDADDY